MVKNFLKAIILGVSDIYANNFTIPATNYKKATFIKSKNRPFTKGKRQKSLKERNNMRKAKRRTQ